ncbi:MAG: hypothetical protein FWH06_04115, partial [Oscillospiraceae bacterium]|nr:hypothetical protein [Oscillospiraceae bacterium]
MTANLNRSLNRANRNASKFAGAFGKQFLFAGTAVATMTAGAGLALGKFINKLMTADNELSKFAEDMGMTRVEAFKTKSALDVMGKTMDEITADPRLLKQFEDLRANAENIRIPDMTEGLERVRDVSSEFLKLKQTAMAGLQWVGHYLLKYIDKPLQDVKKTLGGINDALGKNLPVWAEKIGKALSWIVRLGATLIRGAGLVLNAIKRIFDMIPGNVKMVMGILVGLAAFIRAGPIGRLMMVFSLLMLLVDDFFTYLDGGESLLGGFWKKLIDIWTELNKQGGVIEKLKNGFEAAMQTIGRGITFVIEWVRRLWGKLLENNAVDNFKKAFQKVGGAVEKVFQAVRDIFRALFGNIREAADGASSFFAWLIGVALPGVIGLLADVIGVIAKVVGWVAKLDGIREVIIGIVAAIGIYKAAIIAIIAVKKAWAAIQGILNAVTAANPIMLIVAAIGALIAVGYLLVKNWDKVKEFFVGLWDKIKGIFSGIGNWFKEKFEAAKEAVVGAFRGAIDWIKDNWKAIVAFILNPFAGVFKYLYDNFEGFRNFVDGVVASIAGFFKGLWGNIVAVFSSIGDWFRDTFGAAATGITGAFDSILGFFARIADGIKAIFQPIIDWFKDKFGWIADVAGGVVDKVKGFFGGKSKAQTGHSEGVISTGEHDATISEGGKAEAIIPLSKPRRAKNLLRQAAGFIGMSGDSFGDGRNTAQILERMTAFIDSASSSMRQMNQLATAGAVAGAMNNTSTVNDNREFDMRSTFNVYDSSGN